MINVYSFKIGEYDLIVKVTHKNIHLSFNKDSNKGVSEHQLFIIPLVDGSHNCSEFIKYCDEHDKTNFPFLGGNN